MSILITLCLITTTCVLSGKQVHHVFVSRKSRSNSAPIATGLVYNQVNNSPGTLSIFGNDRNSEPVLENYSELAKFILPHPIRLAKRIANPYRSTLAKRESNYAKSESKSYYLPSIMKTDDVYETIKSAMNEPEGKEYIPRYDNNDYTFDDDDVGTSPRGINDWPSYHYNPYEYDHMKIDAEIEKAKDKRYAVDSAKIIPIHEDLSHDIPNSYEYSFTPEYYQATDNPMKGHDPFFSFVLNDYFDKNSNDDHLSLKGLDWGDDFDITRPFSDVDVHPKRDRRLENNYRMPIDHGTTKSHLHDLNEIKAVHSDSVTEKGFNKKHEYDKHEKGNQEKFSDKINYIKNKQKHNVFKDFVDDFANKFGAEDHKRDSKFFISQNKDHGEKKKGFHRVYHKDEYQEDNEFYNNNDNHVESEEKGSSNAHIGGSSGHLSTHASAAVGNKLHDFNKASNAENNTFENDHKAHDRIKGYDGLFNTYRDVARQAADSNNADYSDRYRI